MIVSQKSNSSTLSKLGQVNWKRLTIMISDVFVIPAAYMLAFYIRLGDSFFSREIFIFLQTLPFVMAIRFLTFKLYGLYRGAWQYASVPDMMNITKAVTTSTLAMVASTFFLRTPGFPRSVFAIDWLLVLFAVGASRFFIRLRKEMWRPGRPARRALIIGGGDAGEMLVREMQRDTSSLFVRLCFV
jgi:O-antigen biosynthesis protein WbqV